MDDVAPTLRLLHPGELSHLWSFVNRLERVGDISPAAATRWKDGIFELMVLRGLEPHPPLFVRPGTADRRLSP